MYAQYINEHLIIKAPRLIIEANKSHANPASDVLQSHGYLEVVEDNIPSLGENEYVETTYRVENGVIHARHEVRVMEQNGEEGGDHESQA